MRERPFGHGNVPVCRVERPAPPTNLLVRAVRRVVAHRWEAAVVAAFMVAVAALSVPLHGFPRLAGAVDRAPAAWGGLVVAFALLWLPIAVIDARRCTRETTLRAQVEADLDARRNAEAAEEKRLRAIEEKVRAVLRSGGPRIVYQPIVDMDSREVVAYEALSRFPDAVAPDRWFAEAAEVGLRKELEMAAVEVALGGVQFLPPQSALTVNVSPDVMAEPELITSLCRQCGDRIILELTENAVIDNYGRFRDSWQRLRACGVRLAVDDAGAGYASFRHIVDLSPDVIKIDGSLVRNLDGDPARCSLIGAFVTFARDIGAFLVAECVETPAEEAELRRWGLQFAQGWLYGSPQPLDRHGMLPTAEGAAGAPSLLVR